jgi:glycosyltransferase involved in cell wall biosynthesis
MGGGTTVVLQLARRMHDAGTKVRIATEPGSELVAEAKASGIPCYEVDFSRRLNSAAAAVRLCRVIRDAQPGVVHAHGARAGLPCALIPRVDRPQLAYTVHGFHYHAKPVAVRRLAWLCELACIRRADATVFVSASDLMTACRDGLVTARTRREVIYNGAEVSAPGRSAPDHDVAFLGRLHPQKDPLILAEIARLATGLRFLVIGDGDLMHALRARVVGYGLEDRFTFAGALRRDAALEALSRCRAMVLPSLWEGLPLAVAEAMHLGIPVVASDLPGLREMVVPGATGYLAPPRRADLFAEALRQLLGEGGTAAEFSPRARDRAARLFSIDSQVSRHMAFYAGLAAPAVARAPAALAA